MMRGLQLAAIGFDLIGHAIEALYELSELIDGAIFDSILEIAL